MGSNEMHFGTRLYFFFYVNFRSLLFVFSLGLKGDITFTIALTCFLLVNRQKFFL